MNFISSGCFFRSMSRSLTSNFPWSLSFLCRASVPTSIPHATDKNTSVNLQQVQYFHNVQDENMKKYIEKNYRPTDSRKPFKLPHKSFVDPGITKKRGLTYRPSAIKRMRKHGLAKRLSTKAGRELLWRRVLKGKWWMST